jgi:hypothetical protein
VQSLVVTRNWHHHAGYPKLLSHDL